ncbi:MAG: rhtA [Sphingomonas bacterium]|nr:rhtA [Sphingomonas bacterium]
MTTDTAARDGRRRTVLLPLAALLVAMVSIQFGASFAKRLFPVVGAEGTTALRLGLASIILFAVPRPWRSRLSRASLPALLVYGASLGAMNLLFYMAIRTVPLGIAVGLEFVGPLAVAMVSSRRAIDFAWIALAVAGLALLLPAFGGAGSIDPAGAALALAAGGCWALYIVFGQKAGAAHGAQATAFGSIVAALIVMPIGIAHAGTSLLAPPVLLTGLVVALLSSALPYSLEMIALTRLPTRTFGTLMSGEPAVAAVIGFAVLGEALTPVQWLGIGAVMLASAGTALTAHPAATALPD